MIRGNQVALTELREVDKNTLRGWINSPEIVRFNAPYSPVHEPSHAAWFERIVQDTSRVVFAIRALDGQRLIGMVQLVDLHPIHRTCELIIRIGSEQDRNRGAGSEAVRLAIDFAFRDRNLQRVWLRVFGDNARAIRAYEKAGMTREGVLRRACFIDGRWQDEVVMAVLAKLDAPQP